MVDKIQGEMCVGRGKVLPFVSQVTPGNTAQHSVPPSLDLFVGKGEGKGVCVCGTQVQCR